MGIPDLSATFDRGAVMRQFDAEMRRDPPLESGMRIERAGPVTRVRGAYNEIAWWSLTDVDVDAAVAREARTFAAAGEAVEWKVYGHDTPATLPAALARHGFTAGETETLMVCDLARDPAQARIESRGRIDVRRVVDAAGLADLVAVASSAFARDQSWMFDALGPRLAGSAPLTAAYVAYVDDAPVGGGGTIPRSRESGVFSTLVAVRLHHARDAGYRYVTVDARATSRPILERLGFVALAPVTGWHGSAGERAQS